MSENSISVLVVDDHQLVAEVLSMHLGAQGDFDSELAHSVDEALAVIAEKGPFDVVLLDLWMPSMNGLEGMARVIEANVGGRVVLMSGNLPPSIVKDAVHLGAAGCIPKSLPAKSLVNAIRFVAAGEIFVPFHLVEAEPDARATLSGLSERERLVLSGLSRGLTNKEIGRELGLSEVTVKMHVRTICGKLGVKNRTQAALIAQQEHQT